jgi:hypothetical protein
MILQTNKTDRLINLVTHSMIKRGFDNRNNTIEFIRVKQMRKTFNFLLLMSTFFNFVFAKISNVTVIRRDRNRNFGDQLLFDPTCVLKSCLIVSYDFVAQQKSSLQKKWALSRHTKASSFNSVQRVEHYDYLNGSTGKLTAICWGTIHVVVSNSWWYANSPLSVASFETLIGASEINSQASSVSDASGLAQGDRVGCRYLNSSQNVRVGEFCPRRLTNCK